MCTCTSVCAQRELSILQLHGVSLEVGQALAWAALGGDPSELMGAAIQWGFGVGDVVVMVSLLGVTPGHLKSRSYGKASNGGYVFLGWMHGPRPLPLLSTFPRLLPAVRCITVQLQHAGTWPWLWVPACLVFIPPPRNTLCFVLGAFPWLQGRAGGSKERSVCQEAVAAAILLSSVVMPWGH